MTGDPFRLDTIDRGDGTTELRLYERQGQRWVLIEKRIEHARPQRGMVRLTPWGSPRHTGPLPERGVGAR